MVNGRSYLGLASRAEVLNVGKNSQVEPDGSAWAGFTTSENQTRRQVKNLTIILTNKKQKVQTIVLVNIRMSVKLRRKCS